MSRFISLKKFALGVTIFFASSGTVLGMDYEVQLLKVPNHKPKHHMKSCIILGEKSSPEGIINFYKYPRISEQPIMRFNKQTWNTRTLT